MFAVVWLKAAVQLLLKRSPMHEQVRMANQTHDRLTPATIRHNIAMEVEGGYSNIIARFLRLLLAGPSGLSTAGVALDLGDRGSAVLFARLANIVADGEGFELAYEWRGASSIRPCLRHWNVLSRDSDLAHRDGSGTFCDISECDASKFKAYTHDELRENARTIVEATARKDAGLMTQTRLHNIKYTVGFNCSRHGLLCCNVVGQHCDLAGVITLDWMHTFLQTGVLNDAVYNMIAAAGPHGATLDNLQQYLKQDWRYPFQLQGKSKHLHEVFDVRRNRTDKLKCSASELLGVCGMVRAFIECRIPDEPSIRLQREAFLAACAVVDAILSVERRGGGRAQAPHIAGLVREAQQKLIAAYGRAALKPKHHWAFDIPEQIMRDDAVLDAFVLERLHLRTKRVTEQVCNTRRFEASTLAGNMASQKHSLQDGNACGDGLRGDRGSLVEFPSARVADSLVYGQLRLKTGDLAQHRRGTGLILACALEDGALFVIVNRLDKVQELSPHCSKWRHQPGFDVFDIAGVTTPLAWQEMPDDTVLVIT